MKIKCVVTNKHLSGESAMLIVSPVEDQSGSAKAYFAEGYTPGGELRILGLKADLMTAYEPGRIVTVELTPEEDPAG